MRNHLSLMIVCALIVGLVAGYAHAQRGTGGEVGVARQGIQPKTVTLSGTITAIKIGPCGKTTGRSISGTHVLMKMEDGSQRNIHLGPKVSVSFVSDKLAVGQSVIVQAFRTEKLPAEQYIAQSLQVGKETIQLRDASLRPVWASGNANQMGRVGRGPMRVGQGRKAGRGRSLPIEFGQGQGHNATWGKGRSPCLGQPAPEVSREQGLSTGQGLGLRADRGQGRAFGRGQNVSCIQQLNSMVDSYPKVDLNERILTDLRLMREKEKLAHDVYVTLGIKWALRPFENISQAESKHMQMVKLLLDRYGQEDPIEDTTIGKFIDSELKQEYDRLVAQGKQSIEEAIKVGMLIEERDIADLGRLIEQTTHDDLKVVYQNLRKGSRNHLRAFTRQLGRYNASYSPQHLIPVEFERIAQSNNERGIVITDPNFNY